MRLSIARIAPLHGRVDIDPGWMRCRLWEHRSADSRVEHIRVVPGPGCLRVGAFTLSADQCESDDALRHVINATIWHTPRIRHWRLLSQPA